MRDTVNPELLRMARAQFAGNMQKSAIVPPGGGMDPAMGGAPMGGALAPGGMNPSMMPPPQGAPAPDMSMGADQAAMTAMAPPAPAPAPAPAAPAQQKLKPEQMMQMIDYRMYNMQQQLTAIMNTLGVQLPPEAIVLPPGSTSAPPAESALPGAAGDPAMAGGGATAPQGQPPAPEGGGVYAGADPAQTGGAVQPIQPTKAAHWWENSRPPTPVDLQSAAAAAMALYNSRAKYAD